jgi:Amt family ammonium transporter
MTLSALGTIILWFGWYGFNCGSGSVAIAGKVATTTTISAAASCVTGVVLGKVIYKTWDVGIGLNCVLAGLVSITAGANVVEPWGAFLAGMLGAMLYMLSSTALKKFKIDDPLDAFSVHGTCGFWGLLVVGIFGTKDAFIYSTGSDGGCSATVGCLSIFLANLCFGLSIFCWTAVSSLIIFGGLKLIGKCFPEQLGKNYPRFEPPCGMDVAEHGGHAYVFDGDVEMPKLTAAPVTSEVFDMVAPDLQSSGTIE